MLGESTLLILMVGAAAVFVATLALAVRSLRPAADPTLARLRAARGLDDAVGLALMRRELEAGEEPSSERRSHLARRLVWGGVEHPHAMRIFLGAKALLAMALPGVFLAVNLQRSEPLEKGPLIAVGLALLGLFLPNLWLRGRVNARQLAIRNAMPDALDLLTTCVEAGLGLDAAVSRVSGELFVSAPVLAGELRRTFLEVGAGLSRTEAFRRLGERTGVDDVRSLAATLAQTERFGTSVATALRVQAEWMRTRRMQVAEERAAKVAVKMTVPLVLCILPSLVAIIMGPGAMRIAQDLLPRMGGSP